MSPENDEVSPQPSADGSEDLRTFPSLLPDLLRRLGLERGQKSKPRVIELLADLKRSEWSVRARAAQQLGELGERAPLEPLLAALDDVHVSVRANAVLALSMLGKRAPIERLSQALLSDNEWQVRESAALALVRLGRQAPEAPLLAALHDPDTDVRSAARLALEQSSPESPGQSEKDERKTFQHINTKENQHALSPVFKQDHRADAYIYEETEHMNENHSPAEVVSSTDRRASRSEPVQRPRHPAWRVVSLGVVAAVVIVNLLAWALLAHVLKPGTHTGSAQPSRTASPNPGPLGKTLFVYPSNDQIRNSTSPLDDFQSVGWSSDGKYISLSGFDLRLLNPSNGRVEEFFSGGGWSRWSPDGTRIAISSQNVQILDVKTENVLATYTPQAAQSSIAAPHGNPLARLSGGNMVYDSAWSADSKLIASAVNGNAYGYNVQIWNAATGAYVRTLQIKPNANYNDYIEQVAWSADGKYLAANSPNDGLVIWDTTTWQHVYTRQGVTVFAWSPLGAVIATGDSGGQVQVWVAAGATIDGVQFTFQGQSAQAGVDALAWSPDGKYVAASGQDVRVWDVVNNKLHYIYTGHGKADAQNVFSIRALAWSPDSTEIASMESGTHIIEPHVGTPLDSVRVWIAV